MGARVVNQVKITRDSDTDKTGDFEAYSVYQERHCSLSIAYRMSI